MDWTVYILECADGSYYTGIAKDVEARLHAHQTGRGAKYTRTRRPVTLMYTEPAGEQGDAMRRELAIKRMRKADKARLIAKD